MEQISMTAQVSAFARAYHAEISAAPVFNDFLAGRLLGEDTYAQIAGHMTQGAAFFGASSGMDAARALRFVVDRRLGPTPLGRAAFAEDELERAVRAGTTQYLILGAGYDTFVCRRPAWAGNLAVFEIDHPVMSAEKRACLQRAGLTTKNAYLVAADLTASGWQRALLDMPVYDSAKVSFCSLLGLTYYLGESDFTALLGALAGLLPQGSRLAFDYPAMREEGADKRALAAAAGERMRAVWTPKRLEQTLKDKGFAVQQRLTAPEITARYFAAHNRAEPAHPMEAEAGVEYCLAMRQ